MNLFEKLDKWKNESDPSHHSKYGPSRLDIWKKCSRFVNRVGEPGEAALRGTKIHESIAATLLNREFPDDIPQDILNPVNNAVNWLINQRVIDSDLSPIQGISIFVEQRLFNSIDNNDGTADFIAITKAGEALIVDWKSGRATYNASDLLQTQAYALCLLEAGAVRVKCMIVSVDKLSNMFATDAVSETVFTRKDTAHIKHTIETLIDVVKNKSKAPVTGRHCNWCNNINVCVAINPSPAPDSGFTPERFVEMYKQIKALNVQFNEWLGFVKQNPSLLDGTELEIVPRSKGASYNLEMLKSSLSPELFNKLTKTVLLSQKELAEAAITDEDRNVIYAALNAARLEKEETQLLRYRGSNDTETKASGSGQADANQKAAISMGRNGHREDADGHRGTQAASGD